MDANNNSDKNNSINDNFMFNEKYLVDRILYINDTLYTLSNGLIKANDLNNLKEKSKVSLKTAAYSKGYQNGASDVIPLPAPQIVK